MTDMKHMDYLEQVMNEDLSTIRRKESTYKGSWKKRGGVGAAMMVLRKIDRLENMLETRGFDIFKDVGDGSDGTMIAEIRDLRGYLILAEAEILAQNQQVWVQVEPTKTLRFKLEPTKPGTPEDGGHHARYMPSRLDDGLARDQIDPSEMNYYMHFDGIYLVNRITTPEDLWGHLPRLPRELNHKEHTELQPSYQPLYQWINEKWRLSPLYVDKWGRE